MDSGASVKVNEDYIHQFAIMGSAYMNAIYGIDDPRVALVNNGAEESKGGELQLASYQKLSESQFVNFIGNVEGNQLPFAGCDVALTDGFVGNVVLKTIEGMGKLMSAELKAIFKSGLGGMLAYLLVKKQLKGFKKKRPFSQEEIQQYKAFCGERGEYIASHLQKGLRAFSLNSHPGLNSAFANDVDGDLNYAQQLSAMGRKGDVFIGISTGGNASNIEAALITAQMMGITTILLTGNRHVLCEKYADIVIDAPAGETYIIQEYHLAIYHALCLEVEASFFDI
jgi:D-sedoheptulose 7-phosphate isomerase